ncbi:MAG: hypothetical protein AVDCRST_MAG32-2606 [uncultured Nocardioides sp.]|uniref:Secreted protein n=1 Tax=uncultured Nocardioides sp. TaxID=198441 RepID=A0A6J4NU08_9ACTN|nr:MAG: hypothetical protein AVDCRST_MAG32-2606 [uncultured Nocardioides sp.]
MKRALTVMAAGTTAALVLGVAPAHAEGVTFDDPQGDASGRGGDIVRTTVRNLDRAVVVKVQLAGAVRSDVIVSVDPRGASGVRLISDYRGDRPTRSFVLPGAFSDRRPGRSDADCGGLRVRWNDDRDTVVMRLPSRCLQGGDYGAIRLAVLTENGTGDADSAPAPERGDIGSSAWVSRG